MLHGISSRSNRLFTGGLKMKKGLGKGLDALFDTTTIGQNANLDVSKSTDHVIKVKINEVEPNKEQPRKSFDEEKLINLSESIKEHGVVQPIIVKKDGNKYKIVAGERRWRASRLAGLNEVPVIVKDVTTKELMEIALIENIQREDLNPIEEAEAFDKLMKEYNITQERLSKIIGKSRSAIANTVRLLSLSDNIKNLIVSGEITSGHARAVLGVDNKITQQKIIDEILKNGLNVRVTERLIKNIDIKEKKKTNKKEKDINIISVEDNLKSIFGTKVDIVQNDKKGKIVIEYYSKEELNRIIEIMENIK